MTQKHLIRKQFKSDQADLLGEFEAASGCTYRVWLDLSSSGEGYNGILRVEGEKSIASTKMEPILSKDGEQKSIKDGETGETVLAFKQTVGEAKSVKLDRHAKVGKTQEVFVESDGHVWFASKLKDGGDDKVLEDYNAKTLITDPATL